MANEYVIVPVSTKFPESKQKRISIREGGVLEINVLSGNVFFLFAEDQLKPFFDGLVQLYGRDRLVELLNG
jgi:hypothetical protein